VPENGGAVQERPLHECCIHYGKLLLVKTRWKLPPLLFASSLHDFAGGFR